MNNFNQLCAAYGMRATTVRRQLYALLQQHSPLLAAEYIDIAQRQGFDTVSIYRTVNLFQKLGIIYEFGSGKQRTIQLQTKSNDQHHHYIRCDSCNKVAKFEDSYIEQQLLAVAKQNGFMSVNSHYLEVVGTCVACGSFSRTA